MNDLDMEYDLEEALQRVSFSRNDLRELSENLPNGVPKNLTDKQLALFLNACENVEDAKKVIKIYYDAKRNAPEHFSNRDPSLDTIQQCFDNQLYFTIPPTEKEGCPIIYHKINNPYASNYYFDNAVKTYCMTLDMALYKYGPRPGIIIIHDLQNAGFGHMLRSNLSSMRKYTHYFQSGLPAKLCRIHVLNVIPLFHKMMTIIKPFMKKELLENIYIHESSMDYEQFYKDWIPKSHLPSDYGGELKSAEELNEDFRKEVLNLRHFFIAEEDQLKNIST